jgi:hypothetical protein
VLEFRVWGLGLGFSLGFSLEGFRLVLYTCVMC